MPCLRQTSSVLAPTSCSRRIAMICSSLNLERFIVRLPYLDGLYCKLEESQGLRSSFMGNPFRTLPLERRAADHQRFHLAIFHHIAFDPVQAPLRRSFAFRVT